MSQQVRTGAARRREADRWVAPFFKQYWKALALALVLGVATFGFASGLMVTSGFKAMSRPLGSVKVSTAPPSRKFRFSRYMS